MSPAVCDYIVCWFIYTSELEKKIPPSKMQTNGHANLYLFSPLAS